MDDSRFRLLQLPQNAFFNVLRSMHTVEVVLLSLISKKAAVRVKSLNIKCDDSEVQIRSRTITLEMYIFDKTTDFVDFKFIYPRSHQCDVDQPHLAKIYISEYHQGHPPVKHRVSRQFGSLPFWMDHLKFLFNFSKVDAIWLSESQFDLQSIFRTFPSPDFLSIKNGVYLEDSRELLETIPITNNFSIENDICEESKFPDQVLFGNYDELFIEDTNDLVPFLKLDDILQTNGKYIEVRYLALSEKELNRLLKLWSRGAWSRLEKMELFTVMAPREPNKDVIFKGMKYQNFPLEHEQKHVISSGTTDLVVGGFGIFRKDGTRATVTLSQEEEILEFSLFVWHPHCIGET